MGIFSMKIGRIRIPDVSGKPKPRENECENGVLEPYFSVFLIEFLCSSMCYRGPTPFSI